MASWPLRRGPPE